MEKISQKIYLTYYNVLKAQDLASSLLNLVNNLSEGIHRIKCKFWNDDKKFETYGIKYKYSDCFLEHTNFKYKLV